MDPIRYVESVGGYSIAYQVVGDGPLDIVFVPGGGDAVGTVMQDSTYVDFVREAGGKARMAGSICTGAFIVAAAGLFDGREVTTYWSQRENLALFPTLTVSAGYPRFAIHGNRFSGGGISSCSTSAQSSDSPGRPGMIISGLPASRRRSRT